MLRLGIIEVEQQSDDAVLVNFNDGTYSSFTVVELAALHPQRVIGAGDNAEAGQDTLADHVPGGCLVAWRQNLSSVILSCMSAHVKASISVLPAADVAASLHWWTQICGFTETFRDSTPPNYVGIERDGASMHISCVSDAGVARMVGEQTMVRIVVDDVAAFFDEYIQRGGVVHPNGGMQSKPWGTIEFAAIDPGGVCVSFVE